MLRALTLAVLLIPSASAQTYAGRLEATDDTLTSGEFSDAFAVEARRGQSVRAVVTSPAFDTYVIVRSATGEQAEDDDCTDGETTRSCATFSADADGPVLILVTSFGSGERGPYEIAVTVDGAPSPLLLSETGGPNTLGPGSDTLQTGEFVARHALAVSAGAPRRVLVTTADFDPYLIAIGPDGARLENDACAAGDRQRACIDLDPSQPGTWQIWVTTRVPGERGGYMLEMGAPVGAGR